MFYLKVYCNTFLTRWSFDSCFGRKRHSNLPRSAMLTFLTRRTDLILLCAAYLKICMINIENLSKNHRYSIWRWRYISSKSIEYLFCRILTFLELLRRFPSLYHVIRTRSESFSGSPMSPRKTWFLWDRFTNISCFESWITLGMDNDAPWDLNEKWNMLENQWY